MKKILIILISFTLNSCALNSTNKENTLFQISTIDALLAGVFDTELDSLNSYGDFGLGTYNQFDGELIMLDSKLYKVKHSGDVELMDSLAKSPFINLNFFKADTSFSLEASDFDSLKRLIKKSISNAKGLNLPYAIKIHGDFNKLKLRSVPSQAKPYKEVKDIIAEQNIFNYESLTGTLVGYWLPAYFKSVSVPDFHFHFISDDRSKGGHVLDLAGLENAAVELDELHKFEMLLPESSRDFRLVNTTKDRSAELEKVEK